MASNIRQYPELPIENSLCFTGHRPEKLPQGALLTGLIETLQFYIRHAIQLGYTHYLTGMADGIDYLAAAYLFRLRNEYPSIRVIGIQPCMDYESFFRRRGYSLRHLYEMQQQVDQHIILSGSSWDKGIFLRRNRFMVDHTSGIIAVCGKGRSGSLHTLHYAQQLNQAYCHIFPEPPAGTIPAPEEWPAERSGF